MNATNKSGHAWTGEREGDWWNYRDDQGREYQSRETPAYRVRMDNATQIIVNGKLSIGPITADARFRL